MDGEKLPPITALRVSDPDFLATGVLGATLEACQLQPGPVPSALARAPFHETCLDMVHLGPSMLFSGAAPGGSYTLVFVLACPTPGVSFNFQREHTDGYIGFFAPGGPLDAMTPAGYRNGTLTIPVAAFHEALPRYFEHPPAALLARGAALHVGAAAQNPLRAILGAMWEMVWDPAQPLASDALRRNIERTVRTAFMEALRSGSAHLLPQPARRVARRHCRFRQARDFIAAHLREPIYVDDVCRAAGLTRRAMEVLFQDFVGITLTAYLRHQRLHGVNRALRTTPHAPGVVKRAALEWGFWHQGHFARDYRALFGESPHESLLDPAARSHHGSSRMRSLRKIMGEPSLSRQR